MFLSSQGHFWKAMDTYDKGTCLLQTWQSFPANFRSILCHAGGSSYLGNLANLFLYSAEVFRLREPQLLSFQGLLINTAFWWNTGWAIQLLGSRGFILTTSHNKPLFLFGWWLSSPETCLPDTLQEILVCRLYRLFQYLMLVMLEANHPNLPETCW